MIRDNTTSGSSGAPGATVPGVSHSDQSKLVDPVEQQHAGYEQHYGDSDLSKWEWHSTPDKATRFEIDRLIDRGIDRLLDVVDQPAEELSTLITCGGVGGEASHLRRRGFVDIVNSDFSSSALRISELREPDVPTRELNAEALDLPDGSFDIVVERFGLHHLGRPVLGLTEMLRVARKAVMFAEPHSGVLARLLGQEFEEEAPGSKNYVFRWNEDILEQATRSYLLEMPLHIEVVRLAHHRIVWQKLEKLTGGRTDVMYPMLRAFYGALTPMNRMGNLMVGIVVKHPPSD